MSDAERAIGRLEGKMDLLLQRMSSMEKKIEGFGLWKAKLIGVATTLGMLAGYLAKFL